MFIMLLFGVFVELNSVGNQFHIMLQFFVFVVFELSCVSVVSRSPLYKEQNGKCSYGGKRYSV